MNTSNNNLNKEQLAQGDGSVENYRPRISDNRTIDSNLMRPVVEEDDSYYNFDLRTHKDPKVRKQYAEYVMRSRLEYMEENPYFDENMKLVEESMKDWKDYYSEEEAESNSRITTSVMEGEEKLASVGRSTGTHICMVSEDLDSEVFEDSLKDLTEDEITERLDTMSRYGRTFGLELQSINNMVNEGLALHSDDEGYEEYLRDEISNKELAIDKTNSILVRLENISNGSFKDVNYKLVEDTIVSVIRKDVLIDLVTVVEVLDNEYKVLTPSSIVKGNILIRYENKPIDVQDFSISKLLKDSGKSQKDIQSKMIDTIAALVVSGKSYDEAYKEVTAELINIIDDALVIEYLHYSKEEVISKVKIIVDKLVDKSTEDWNNTNNTKRITLVGECSHCKEYVFDYMSLSNIGYPYYYQCNKCKELLHMNFDLLPFNTFDDNGIKYLSDHNGDILPGFDKPITDKVKKDIIIKLSTNKKSTERLSNVKSIFEKLKEVLDITQEYSIYTTEYPLVLMFGYTPSTLYPVVDAVEDSLYKELVSELKLIHSVDKTIKSYKTDVEDYNKNISKLSGELGIDLPEKKWDEFIIESPLMSNTLSDKLLNTFNYYNNSKISEEIYDIIVELFKTVEDVIERSISRDITNVINTTDSANIDVFSRKININSIEDYAHLKIAKNNQVLSNYIGEVRRCIRNKDKLNLNPEICIMTYKKYYIIKVQDNIYKIGKKYLSKFIQDNKELSCICCYDNKVYSNIRNILNRTNNGEYSPNFVNISSIFKSDDSDILYSYLLDSYRIFN